MDYLIEENNTAVHYFVKTGEGLMRRSARGGSWQPRECILRGAHEGFGLYTDGKTVHIVTATDAGEMIYITGDDKSWRRFILKKLGQDFHILTIKLYPVRGRLNMLYTVSVKDEILLMHCILGNNAKPNTVSKLLTDDFFISNMRVYYAMPDGRTGFCELADEKPELFIRIADNCGVPYVFGGHMAYISNGKIYFDSRELCCDEEAERLIITESDARLFAAWKSGDFVRYLPADARSAQPHCIINPAREAKLYAVWRDDNLEYFYGSNSETELVTYINPSPFGPRTNCAADSLRRRLEDMKNEINDLRRRLAEGS